MTLERAQGPDRDLSLGRARGFLMGLAIMWIMFFHYRIALGAPVFSLLNRFIRYGFFGVDLFLLLSAYGLCFSYDRDRDLGRYLGRRAKRILPFYLLNVAFLHLVDTLYRGLPLSLPELAGNLTFTGIYFRLPNQTNWYLQAIWVFYLLFPFLFGLLVRRKRLTASAAVLALLSLLLLPAVRSTGADSVEFYIAGRIPSFVLGVLFGLRALRGQKISLGLELTGYAALIADFFVYTWLRQHCYDYINETGLCWPLMVPMLPGLLFLGGRVHHLLSRRRAGRWAVKAVEELGACSMELLVVHLLFRSYVDGFFSLRLREKLLCMLLSILIAIPLHRLIQAAVSRTERWLAARKADV